MRKDLRLFVRKAGLAGLNAEALPWMRLIIQRCMR